MLMAATYVCPVRGLAGLEPAEPMRLGQAAKAAKSLSLDRLLIPVLEESLLEKTRVKVRFLDGLVQDLDQVEEAGMTVWLMATAQRVLRLDWVPPYLAKGSLDSRAGAVFVDGKLRNLRPFKWWHDPSIVQKRIKIFRELVAAVSGHPALTGWIIMDRALEWPRPDFQVADLVLKSYCAEVRERDETGSIYLSLGLSELLDPKMVRTLSLQIDGLRMRGFDSDLEGFEKCADLPKEILMAAYVCTLAQWLFEHPLEVEIGWSIMSNMGNPEEVLEAILILSAQGAEIINWLSLIDPEKELHSKPPWSLQPGLEKAGLLDQAVEPKREMETLIQEIRSSQPRRRVNDFIDISREDYVTDPHAHFHRLWQHFQESI